MTAAELAEIVAEELERRDDIAEIASTVESVERVSLHVVTQGGAGFAVVILPAGATDDG